MSEGLEKGRSRATVITVGNPKGGVGKSTTCVNLAIEALKRKKKVMIIDSDDQATVDKFIAKREKYLETQGLDADSDVEHVIQRSNIPKFLRQNLKRFDWIIIDTKGKSSEEFVISSVWSDIVISPTTDCEADSDELDALQKLMVSVNSNREALGLEPNQAHVFINKVDSRTFNTTYIPSRKAIKERMESEELPYLKLMKSYLTYYGAYKLVHKTGKGITEFQDKSKGQFQVFVNEIESLDPNVSND
ncbi:ParA family protein [Photobacterium leiognathi]|uniref:ParA family protein n=1 Tax=Photobacterium leiognathi TaxID=553611 RepID=UPI0029821916|nr:ParA family protein [Photobacterium leiognathi]